MKQRFYEIKSINGGFMYHEFIGAYGYVSNDFDDMYIKFSTQTEAEEFAKARGSINAYGY